VASSPLVSKLVFLAAIARLCELRLLVAVTSDSSLLQLLTPTINFEDVSTEKLFVPSAQAVFTTVGCKRMTEWRFEMKRSLFLAFAGLLLLTAGTANAQDVRYNFDKNTDFSRFKTYKWVNVKDAPKLNDLVDKQIKASIDTQLASKGLVRTDDEKADLYVAYQAAVGQEKQFSSYSSGWGYGNGWGGGWYGPGGGMASTTTTGQTDTIYVGQLGVDMYDSANKDLVWRGIASKTIDEKAKPEKQQKNLDKALKKLFKNYPPAAEKK